ncbi:hypothetical protein D3C81_1226700 [compost metagenome]
MSSEVTRQYNIFDLGRRMTIDNEIERLTEATPKTLGSRMVKLCSEVGELAGAIDIAESGAGTKYRKIADPIKHVLEEAIDVDLVNRSLIIQLMQDHNITEDEVFDMYEAKLAKWAKVLELDNEPADS